MRLRALVLAALLLATAAGTGCGFRRSAYRRPCYEPAPALLPAMAVPVTAGTAPCCCP